MVQQFNIKDIGVPAGGGVREGRLRENRMFRTFTKTLTAGEVSRDNIQGNFFYFHSGSGEITVRFDETNLFRSLLVGTGLKFDGDAVYNDIEIENSSASTQTITYVLGFGSLFNFGSGGGGGAASVTMANALQTIADATVTNTAGIIIPSNTTTREVVIKVPTSASNGIRIGDSGVSTSQGIAVGVGEAITLETSAAVYAVRDGASNVSVQLLKLQDT